MCDFQTMCNFYLILFLFQIQFQIQIIQKDLVEMV